MRGKIISCFAAGTFSVCLLYSSISQVLRGQSPAAQAAEAWQIAPAAIVANADTEEIQEEKTEEQQPFPQENNIYGQDSSNEDTFPDVQPSREGRRGKGGGRHGRRNKDSAPDNNENTDSYFPNGNTQFEEEEELEEDSALKDSYESVIGEQQEEPSEGVPALQQQEELSDDVTAFQQQEEPSEGVPALQQQEELSDDVTAFQQQEEPSEGVPALQQQEEPSGDVPTLQQFLSMLRCGGCHRNCILLSPRCMKGRSKAENATIEYQQTYGS